MSNVKCIVDCKLNFNKLFPNDDPNNWNKFSIEKNFILGRIELTKEYTEPIKGTLSLTIIPSDKDEHDLWEASRNAGEWTFWSLLNILLVPTSTNENLSFELNLSFAQNTFFDSEFRNVHRILLEDSNKYLVNLHDLNPQSFDLKKDRNKTLRELFKVFVNEFDAVEINLNDLEYRPMRLE